jgi:hypothetical protein
MGAEDETRAHSSFLPTIFHTPTLAPFPILVFSKTYLF